MTIEGRSEAATASVSAAAAEDDEAGSSSGDGRPSRPRSSTQCRPTATADPVGEDSSGPRCRRQRDGRGRIEGAPPRRRATTRLGANATRGLGDRNGRLIIRGDVHCLKSLAAEVGGQGTQPRRGEGVDRDS